VREEFSSVIEGPVRYPKDADEMKQWGYVFQRSTLCRGCEAAIEWWHTPKGKMLAVNAGTSIGHHTTSPGCFKKLGRR
jgi:hypothetical protein